MADIEFNIPAVLTLVTKEQNGKRRRCFKATASSTARDSHDDEFTESAIEKMAGAVRGGMSVFLNHEYRIPEDLFGTATDAATVVRADEMGEVFKDLDIEGFINEANPRALMTAEALENGAQLGVSIGARVKSYRPRDSKDPLGGWIIDDVELKEASIVGMPANPRTWVHYATKAIRAFERERVKEAVMSDEQATQPEEEIETAEVIDDETDVMKLLDANELQKSAAPEDLMSPPPFEDGLLDLGEEIEVETAEPVEAPEEPSVEVDGPDAAPEDIEVSETPAEALETVLASSAEALSITALRSAISVARDEIVKRDEAIDRLTQERDAALETLATATAIVERIASTPLGRKARFHAEVQDYRTRIGGVYDQEFLKFLKG